MPNSRRCWSCHAAMAGTRNCVRGETYRPSRVEAAVAADAPGDQRLDDGVVGQQLVLGELDLLRPH